MASTPSAISIGHDYREHVEAYRLEYTSDLTERLNMTDGLDDLPEDAQVSVGGLLRYRELPLRATDRWCCAEYRCKAIRTPISGESSAGTVIIQTFHVIQREL